MSVLFRADWTNLDGLQYRVDIHDSNYSGTINSLEIGMDDMAGFLLAYTGENEERHNPILTSECTINCVVQNSTFENFITDLVDADEDRYFVIIYEDNKGSWAIFWTGVVLQDLITQEDNGYDYLFVLTATDGLGRLADTKYPGAESGTYQTFIEYIITCLNEIPTVQFWPTENVFLKTIVNWYENSHFTTAPGDSLDPVAETRVLNDAFMFENNLKIIEAKSCFEVLVQVGLRWNAVLKQSNGYFFFSQINEHENSTLTERLYKKDGSNFGFNINQDYKLIEFNRQGSWRFLQMLQIVTVKYNYKQSLYGFNLLPDQTDYSTDVIIGSIQGGNDEFFIYSGTVKGTCDIGTSGWDSDHRWLFKLKLQVGVYFLTNEDGNTTWSTNSAKRLILATTYYHTITGNYTFSFPFGFTSPSIPGSGIGKFGFDFYSLEDMDGNLVSAPPGVSLTFICKNFTLNLDLDDTLDSGTISTQAANQNSGIVVKATSKLDLPDLLTGDGPDDYSDGALQVYDGAAWGNSDKQWTVGGTGITHSINALLCREIIAGQKSARRIYTGAINGMNLNPSTILVLGGENYLFKSGTFNANNNTWEGEWVEIRVDTSDIIAQDDKEPGHGTDAITKSGFGHGLLEIQKHLKDYYTPDASGGTGLVPTFKMIILSKSATNYQDVGGADGTQTIWTWDGEIKKDDIYLHSKVYGEKRDEVTVTEAGWYEILFVGGAKQTGGARTSLQGIYAINGTVYHRGGVRNYTRGYTYGNASASVHTVVYLEADDVVQVGTEVDDTDAAYTLYTTDSSGDEIYDDEHIFMIKRIGT